MAYQSIKQFFKVIIIYFIVSRLYGGLFIVFCIESPFKL